MLVVPVELPTGALEIITNTSNIDSKLEYYLLIYDDEFRLTSNLKVRIVGAYDCVRRLEMDILGKFKINEA